MQAQAWYKKRVKQAVYAIGRLCAVSPRTVDEGVEICRALHGCGIPATIGRFSKAGDDPSEIVREYRRASSALHSAPFYLSVKPPALGFDLHHAVAITTTAHGNSHGIHFDSHRFVEADRTMQLLADLMDRCPVNDGGGGWRYGLTLQSRWRRSMADARWAVEHGVRARLVKGEFSAGSSEEVDPRSGFLALVDYLAGKGGEVVVATEDHALAREAIHRSRRAGSAVHLELLFGMPTGPVLALSHELGVPVGFYVPYSDTLLVYAVHHFLKNPHKLFRTGFYEVLAGHRTKLARILAVAGQVPVSSGAATSDGG